MSFDIDHIEGLLQAAAAMLRAVATVEDTGALELF